MTEKTIEPVVALAKEAIASDAEGLKALMRAASQNLTQISQICPAGLDASRR